jgi:hypothetical protein
MTAVEQPLIPIDAHSFEVFAIKDCKESPTDKQAFIGFKIANGDFHFIGVPYTEPKQQKEISDEEITKLANEHILYNDSKRQWVIEGMKLYREQYYKETFKSE